MNSLGAALLAQAGTPLKARKRRTRRSYQVVREHIQAWLRAHPGVPISAADVKRGAACRHDLAVEQLLLAVEQGWAVEVAKVRPGPGKWYEIKHATT